MADAFVEFLGFLLVVGMFAGIPAVFMLAGHMDSNDQLERQK